MQNNHGTENQNISFSFDPATLQCISCEIEHSILKTGEGGAPPIIVLSDQNFIPTLCGGGSCVAIARLEDGSLDEIAELAAEFLERNPVPVGTILLLCSISHLHNVGSSIYARDWCSANTKLAARIRNAKVLPLTPILREDGPGSLSRQLIEIHTWYKRVYDKNTLGLLPVWSKLIEILGKTDEDGLDLGFSDTYTVAFPSSLLPDSPLVPTKFFTSSSHTTIRGFDSMATNELLRTLFDHLQCKFATVANPDELLIEEPAPEVVGGKEFSKCIIGGGSNMKRIAQILKNQGIEVIDFTSLGWTPTDQNIKKLCDSIKNLPEKFDGPVILDLLGNYAYRFEQLDGTLAMPFKTSGKYHLGGKVCVCGEQVLIAAIRNLKPVFELLDCPILFLSPNPRYLYNGCCDDEEHCIGVNTDDYVHTLLKDTLSLRAVCKKGILEFGKKDIWVPDLVGKMLPACNGVSEQALGWKQIAAADGVHLIQSGYDKMAAAITVCVENLLNKSALPAVTSVSATPAQKTYYWRGFVSPVGSARPKNKHTAYMNTHRGGGGKLRGHPVNVGQGRGNRFPPPYYRRN
jgi:hypothetical protein